jgi:serine/threonine protein kinase
MNKPLIKILIQILVIGFVINDSVGDLKKLCAEYSNDDFATKFTQINNDTKSGSFGVVNFYTYKPTENEQYEVAVKKQITSVKKLQAVVKEIKNIKKFSDINSERFVKYYKCYFEERDDGKYDIYLVTEKLFKELRDVKNEFANLDTKSRWNHYLYLAQTLELIHKENVAHADIKPENIMVTSEVNGNNTFRLKFIDFGLMTQFKNNLSCTGTPFYMQPYLIFKKLQVSTAIDIYALMLVIVEMQFTNFTFQLENKCYEKIMEQCNSSEVLEEKEAWYKENCFDPLMNNIYEQGKQKYQNMGELNFYLEFNGESPKNPISLIFKYLKYTYTTDNEKLDASLISDIEEFLKFLKTGKLI